MTKQNDAPTSNQKLQNNNHHKRHQEATVDEASKESFPASDAPALVSHDRPPKKTDK